MNGCVMPSFVAGSVFVEWTSQVRFSICGNNWLVFPAKLSAQSYFKNLILLAFKWGLALALAIHVLQNAAVALMKPDWGQNDELRLWNLVEGWPVLVAGPAAAVEFVVALQNGPSLLQWFQGVHKTVVLANFLSWRKNPFEEGSL